MSGRQVVRARMVALSCDEANDEQRAPYLEAPIRDIAVRDAITGEMQRNAEQCRSRLRSHASSHRCASRSVKRSNHTVVLARPAQEGPGHFRNRRLSRAEAASTVLKAPVRGLGTPRYRWKCAAEQAFLAHMTRATFRPVSEARVITLLTPSLPAAACLGARRSGRRSAQTVLSRARVTWQA